MKSRPAAKAATTEISQRAIEAVGIGTVLALGFFVAAVFASGQIGFWYLGWNLFLAYISLALTYPLLAAVGQRGWKSWPAVLWGLAWLVWLPNSFYVLTDVAHLFDHSYGLDPLFDVVLFCLFAGMGMVAGFVSLVAVHRAAARAAGGVTYVAVELVLLVSSVAIYAGRTLRWNSWDVVLHPISLTQGLTTALLQGGRLEWTTILVFFVLLSGVYAAVWHVFGEHK